MASFAYTLHNVFPVSPQAGREMPPSHRESKNCTTQSKAEERCGSYIDLDEHLESSKANGERRNDFEGILVLLCYKIDELKQLHAERYSEVENGCAWVGCGTIVGRTSPGRERGRAAAPADCGSL